MTERMNENWEQEVEFAIRKRIAFLVVRKIEERTINDTWLMKTFNPIFSAINPIVLSRRSRRLQLIFVFISTLH